MIERILDRLLDDALRLRRRKTIFGLALEFGLSHEHRQHDRGAHHHIFRNDVGRALATPEVKERLTALGAEAMPMTPVEFTKFVGVEIDDSGKVIKAANIKVQ